MKADVLPAAVPAEEATPKPKAPVIPLRRPKEQVRQPKQPRGELLLETILKTPAPERGRIRLKCSAEKGFFVLITSNDARSYYVETRIRGRKMQRKVRLGGVRPEDDGYITMPVARSMAKLEKGKAHSIDHRGHGVDISRAAVHANRSISVAEAYAEYKADRTSPKRKKPWAETTIDGYDRAINVYLKDWGARSLFDVTAEQVAAKFVELRDSSCGEAEAKRVFAVFEGTWKFHRFKRPDANLPLSPTMVLKRSQQDLLPETERRTSIISKKDYPAWWRSLDTIPNPTWAVYFRTMALLGTRRTETVKMEWDWYDKKARVINLPAPVTKAKRAAALPVGPYLAKMLEAHRKTQPLKGVRYIFADNSGERFARPDTAVRALRAATKFHWEMHDLRRVYSSVMHDDLRLPLKATKLLMNHSTKGNVTLGYIQIEDLRKYQIEVEVAILKRAKVR